MLYVTNKNLYFYSPFNERTLVGHGTKIKINYSAIDHMKKAHQLLIISESIRIVLNSGGPDVIFTSFISRELCFNLIERELIAFKHAN